MAGREVVTRLSLSLGQRDKLGTEFEADLSFPVSFGRIGYTMKGFLNISGDTTLSEIEAAVLKATYEDLENIPAVRRCLTSLSS